MSPRRASSPSVLLPGTPGSADGSVLFSLERCHQHPQMVHSSGRYACSSLHDVVSSQRSIQEENNLRPSLPSTRSAYQSMRSLDWLASLYLPPSLTLSVKITELHMACRRSARRSRPGYTCNHATVASSCEGARGSLSDCTHTRLELPERATSREWTSADVNLKQSVDTTFTITARHQQKKKWRQTWGRTRRRRHAAEITSRTNQWLKDECKPCEGLKVKDARDRHNVSGKRCSNSHRHLRHVKQVHSVTKQEERVRDSISQ